MGEVAFVKEISRVPLPFERSVMSTTTTTTSQQHQQHHHHDRIKKTSCGTKHSLILTRPHGVVYASGQSDEGQINQAGECINTFTTIYRGACYVKSIGKRSFVIDRESRELILCGENHFCQLGLGDSKNRVSWTIHPFFSKLKHEEGEFVTKVDGGISHTVVMTSKKRFFHFGMCFKLGELSSHPCLLTLNHATISRVKCTHYATFYWTTSQKMYASGLNAIHWRPL
ncbi:hypothetical protein FDP41_000797 [Naegleria fowleri]|uniref:Uncharacterized protein n=1 Tax=Naegleria fowleri TaxID=5763 RepID=A0A6A5CI34_NAEFO|nr:uncharacterized protein FDP41_000797 [Naegleria fowleri]KAF0984898.1 hypothetical protein FDP41_000797 [Naegleria fowleri]